MADGFSVDRGLIRLALNTMPPMCRYHGPDLEPRRGSSREACCETGVPSLRRRRAFEALDRLERAANPD